MGLGVLEDAHFEHIPAWWRSQTEEETLITTIEYSVLRYLNPIKG
jgi:hypothetical protein